MEIATPLGEELLFHRLQAREEMGRLFDYQVDLLSAKVDIDIDKILAKSVTVKLELPDRKTRCFNGYVTRFAQNVSFVADNADPLPAGLMTPAIPAARVS